MSVDKADAEKQFRLVVAKQPYNLAALNNLAWLLREKNPKEGLIYAARAQKLAPNLASVLDTVGWIRWQLNDRGQVMDLLTKAHAAVPTDPEIGYHLAFVLNGSGRSADAKKVVTGILADGKPFEDREKAKALAAQIH
jgi:Tfp pilus assembly protein PilF